jgi:hypothetical protein
MTDNTQSICLDEIQTKARWVVADGSDLRHYCKLLSSLPDFDTLAEEAVENALKALNEAIGHVAEAQAAMQEKRALNPIKEDA